MLDPTNTEVANGSNGISFESSDVYCTSGISCVVEPDENIGEAHTLELNLEDAERFMPEPTVKAPWFGYESSADAGYGENGWDAVADNDGDSKSKSSGGRAPAAKASDTKTDDSGDSGNGGRAAAGAPGTKSDDSINPYGFSHESTSDVTKAPGCSGPEVKEVTIGIGIISVTLGPKDDGGSTSDHHKGNGHDNKK